MMKGIYCPFAAPPGMPSVYCAAATEHCCEGSSSSQPTSCKKKADPCINGYTDWQCTEPSHCGTGMQCCGGGSVVVDLMCGSYGSKFTGSTCKAACAATEITLCSDNAQCPPGLMCLPFAAKSSSIGSCQK